MSWSTYSYSSDGVTTIDGKELDQYVLDKFNFFDKNNNGLTQSEFNQGLKELGVGTKTQSFFNSGLVYDKYIKPYDLDNNGMVTWEELLRRNLINNVDDLKKSVMSEGLNSFNKLDTNGDLFIDKKELRNINSNISQSEIAATIKQADINNDGKISLGECMYRFNNGQDIDLKAVDNDVAKALAKYDINNDGKITQEEIKAHDKEMSKSKGLSTGAIIGIVFGCIAVAGLIVALIYFLTKNNKKEVKKKEEKYSIGNSYDKEKKDVNSASAGNSLDQINEKKKGQAIGG